MVVIDSTRPHSVFARGLRSGSRTRIHGPTPGSPASSRPPLRIDPSVCSRAPSDVHARAHRGAPRRRLRRGRRHRREHERRGRRHRAARRAGPGRERPRGRGELRLDTNHDRTRGWHGAERGRTLRDHRSGRGAHRRRRARDHARGDGGRALGRRRDRPDQHRVLRRARRPHVRRRWRDRALPLRYDPGRARA